MGRVWSLQGRQSLLPIPCASVIVQGICNTTPGFDGMIDHVSKAIVLSYLFPSNLRKNNKALSYLLKYSTVLLQNLIWLLYMQGILIRALRQYRYNFIGQISPHEVRVTLSRSSNCLIY